MGEERDTWKDTVLVSLVGLVAFAAYALCGAASAYPLDSAELATAAFGLGVAHPPGEETSLLWGKLFTLLPGGSVAYRVSLSQAAAGALAVALVCSLVLAAARRLPTVRSTLHPWIVRAVAAASALIFAFAPGMVLSANRPEVYATQVALSLLATRFALRADEDADPRWFGAAALFLGMGVANHALVAGLCGLGAVVVALPALWASPAKVRFVGLGVAAFVVGLLFHAYLPVRAAALLSDGNLEQVAWGDPRTPGGFWWVVSARTFAQKNTIVQGNASPTDLPFIPMEELEPPIALIALIGAYLLLRRPGTRTAFAGLLLTCAGSLGAALWGGMDPANPDTRGYLLPALAVLAVFAGVALCTGIAVFRLSKLRLPLAAIFVVGALSRFPSPGTYPGLRGSVAAQDMAARLLNDVPLRGALFTNHFETGFLLGYGRAVEGWRPDIDRAHLAFAAGPGYAQRVRGSAPDLDNVVSAFATRQNMGESLRALAALRPVRFEPDVMSPEAVRTALHPAGEFWSPTADTRLPDPVPTWAMEAAGSDRQVRGFLGFHLFVDSVWSCERGALERASLRFADLERLLPKDLRVVDLRRRCANASGL